MTTLNIIIVLLYICMYTYFSSVQLLYSLAVPLLYEILLWPFNSIFMLALGRDSVCLSALQICLTFYVKSVVPLSAS